MSRPEEVVEIRLNVPALEALITIVRWLIGICVRRKTEGFYF